jgi:hypothetical protein
MPALCEAADQSPRFAVNVVFKVGQRFLTPLGLALEQEDAQRPKQGEMACQGGLAHWAAVLVLSAIPAIVLPVCDAPVSASHFQSSVGVGLRGPKGGHRKAGVVGFFDHLALAYLLRVAMDAHDLSHSR